MPKVSVGHFLNPFSFFKDYTIREKTIMGEKLGKWMALTLKSDAISIFCSFGTKSYEIILNSPSR